MQMRSPLTWSSKARHGPTTSTASTILADRDIAVIPDILANAGGVTVSYFEWLQDINRRSWSLERVNDELETEMQAAWEAVRTEFEQREVTWRDAAYIVALSRIAEAHEGTGTLAVGAWTTDHSDGSDSQPPRLKGFFDCISLLHLEPFSVLSVFWDMSLSASFYRSLGSMNQHTP